MWLRSRKNFSILCLTTMLTFSISIPWIMTWKFLRGYFSRRCSSHHHTPALCPWHASHPLWNFSKLTFKIFLPFPHLGCHADGAATRRRSLEVVLWRHHRWWRSSSSRPTFGSSDMAPGSGWVRVEGGYRGHFDDRVQTENYNLIILHGWLDSYHFEEIDDICDQIVIISASVLLANILLQFLACAPSIALT